MKSYEVYVDVTMSKIFHIEAENEEQAKQIVRDKFTSTPYEAARGADTFVDFSFVQVEEE